MDGFGADDQRAMMAARYAKAHPQKRGPKTGRKVSTATGRGNSDPRQRTTEQPAIREATAIMNVTPTRTEKAATVLKADPQLADQVHRGELKLAQAAV
jgi:hypothetical protein